VKKIWHPLRFRKWCLEYDDDFFIGVFMNFTNKLWLNIIFY